MIRTSSPRSKTHIETRITPNLQETDQRSTTVTPTTYFSANTTSYPLRSQPALVYKSDIKVAAATEFPESGTAHLLTDRFETDMLYLHSEGAQCHAAAFSPHPIYLTHAKSSLQLYDACSKVTISGHNPEKYKFEYDRAGHSEQELQVAKRMFMAANSSNTPGSGLVPQQKVFRKIPPFQAVAHADHATEPTTYSYMHLDGLPASQSAAASPLGLIHHKLIAFGQSETLNGTHVSYNKLQIMCTQHAQMKDTMQMKCMNTACISKLCVMFGVAKQTVAHAAKHSRLCLSYYKMHVSLGLASRLCCIYWLAVSRMLQIVC